MIKDNGEASNSNIQPEKEASQRQVTSAKSEIESVDLNSEPENGLNNSDVDNSEQDFLDKEKDKIKITDKRCISREKLEQMINKTENITETTEHEKTVTNDNSSSVQNKRPNKGVGWVVILLVGIALVYFLFTKGSVSAINQNDLNQINFQDYFPSANTRLTYNQYGTDKYVMFTSNQTVQQWDNTKFVVGEQVTAPAESGIRPYQNSEVFEVSSDSIKSIERINNLLNTHSTDIKIIITHQLQWGNEPKVVNKITGLNKDISTPAGTFKNCIEVTEENSVEKPSLTELKYYAPKIGLVQEKMKTGNTDFFIFEQLVQYSLPSTKTDASTSIKSTNQLGQNNASTKLVGGVSYKNLSRHDENVGVDYSFDYPENFETLSPDTHGGGQSFKSSDKLTQIYTQVTMNPGQETPQAYSESEPDRMMQQGIKLISKSITDQRVDMTYSNTSGNIIFYSNIVTSKFIIRCGLVCLWYGLWDFDVN